MSEIKMIKKGLMILLILTASMYYSQNAWHCGWLDEYGNNVQ